MSMKTRMRMIYEGRPNEKSRCDERRGGGRDEGEEGGRDEGEEGRRDEGRVGRR